MSSSNLDTAHSSSELTTVAAAATESNAPPTALLSAPNPTTSTAAQQQPTPQLPKQVLCCPDCPFLCVSNNQMARHMSLTMHGLRRCSHPGCHTRLVCFTFVQGVNKFLSRARKDRCLVEAVTVDTPERHADATRHENTGLILQREQFVRLRQPEDEVQVVLPPPPVSDSSKFQCPECAVQLATWSQMTKHLDASRHAMSYCSRCNTSLRCYGISQPSRHEKHTKHHAVVGPFYSKADYVIQQSTTTKDPPSTPQWYCEGCDVAFLHPLHMAEHLVEAHGSRVEFDAACQECGFSGNLQACLSHRSDTHHMDFEVNIGAEAIEPFQVLSLPSPPQQTELPPARPKQCVILFQCPTCCRIFTSWARMEQHLFSTKHSLPFCQDCGTLHKLRPVTEDHQSQTQHRRVYGLQLAKVNFEVLVDIEDAEVLRQIDERPPCATDYDASNAEVILYQCPLKTCLRMFPTLLELKHHAEATRHGYVDCGKCGAADLNALDDDVFHHAHDVPNLPQELLHLRTEKGDFRVLAFEQDVVQAFPLDYTLCDECRSLITIDEHMTGTHRGTLPCRAAKARRSAWSTLQQQATTNSNKQQQQQAAPPIYATPPHLATSGGVDATGGSVAYTADGTPVMLAPSSQPTAATYLPQGPGQQLVALPQQYIYHQYPPAQAPPPQFLPPQPHYVTHHHLPAQPQYVSGAQPHYVIAQQPQYGPQVVYALPPGSYGAPTMVVQQPPPAGASYHHAVAPATQQIVFGPPPPSGAGPQYVQQRPPQSYPQPAPPRGGVQMAPPPNGATMLQRPTLVSQAAAPQQSSAMPQYHAPQHFATAARSGGYSAAAMTSNGTFSPPTSWPPNSASQVPGQPFRRQ